MDQYQYRMATALFEELPLVHVGTSHSLLFSHLFPFARKAPAREKPEKCSRPLMASRDKERNVDQLH